MIAFRNSMPLHFPRHVVLLIAAVAVGFGCGSKPSEPPANAVQASPVKAAFPFPTEVPREFQATLVLTTDGAERRWFIARKQDKSRFDIRDSERPVMSRILNGRTFMVDHKNRTYAIDDRNGGPDSFPNAVVSKFFSGRVLRDVDETGQDGSIRVFKLKPEAGSVDEITVWFDTNLGMITREEFKSQSSDPNASGHLVYELRDAMVRVPDEVFDIPAGYKESNLAAVRNSIASELIR